MTALEPVLAIALVMALLAGAVWALRRRGLATWNPGRTKGALPRVILVERVRLTPQHSLHLVRVAGRGLLISAHPTGCALVENLPWPEIEGRAEALR